MREPFAQPLPPNAERPLSRPPATFAPEALDTPPVAENPEIPPDAGPAAQRVNWVWRLVLGSAGLLVSLATGLAISRLIADLFSLAPWLGTLGLGLAVLLGLGIVALVLREILALRRLAALDDLRRLAARAREDNHLASAHRVADRLETLYAGRAELGRARADFAADRPHILDGADLLGAAERRLLAPLDAEARRMTLAAARRVALVTAVSPKALVDLGFVLFESLRLGRDTARLYGARPGLAGSLRLVRAVLSHLAVTGGLVLTDGVAEQLLGQGMAARLSARLGEGVVNALMTVRVGLAAARVVRPLPYGVLAAPTVRDLLPELATQIGRDARS